MLKCNKALEVLEVENVECLYFTIILTFKIQHSKSNIQHFNIQHFNIQTY